MAAAEESRELLKNMVPVYYNGKSYMVPAASIGRPEAKEPDAADKKKK